MLDELAVARTALTRRTGTGDGTVQPRPGGPRPGLAATGPTATGPTATELYPAGPGVTGPAVDRASRTRASRTRAVSRAGRPAAAKLAAAPRSAAAGRTGPVVRVPAGKIDQMLNLVGEVVLTHRRLEHSAGAVAGPRRWSASSVRNSSCSAS